mgnify:CR=1 FL=1
MKFSKNYVLYAIGEIFLVVVGILIALYINNQSELYKERKYEKVLLEKLKEENLYNLEMLEDEYAYREKLPDLYEGFINYLLENEVNEITDSLEYFMSNTLRSSAYSFSKTNLINYINSQKNNFPEINKEAIYLENLQEDLVFLSKKAVDLKIDDYYKYLKNDFDFSNGDVYSTDAINSVGFRNNLNLIFSVESEITLKFNTTRDQMKKVDSLITTVVNDK